MCVSAMVAVFTRSKSEGMSRLVLLAIADAANEDGVCWPSVKRIAAKCNCQERCVQYALAELVELGELRREQQSIRSTNTFTITLIEGAQACTGGMHRYAPGGAQACTLSQSESKDESKDRVNTHSVHSAPIVPKPEPPVGDERETQRTYEPAEEPPAGHVPFPLVKRLYALYPRPMAPLDAYPEIERAIRRVAFDDQTGAQQAFAYLESRVKRYASSEYVRTTPARFIAAPAKWFRNGGYLEPDAQWDKAYGAGDNGVDTDAARVRNAIAEAEAIMAREKRK